MPKGKGAASLVNNVRLRNQAPLFTYEFGGHAGKTLRRQLALGVGRPLGEDVLRSGRLTHVLGTAVEEDKVNDYRDRFKAFVSNDLASWIPGGFNVDGVSFSVQLSFKPLGIGASTTIQVTLKRSGASAP